jgi:hypothetical protein
LHLLFLLLFFPFAAQAHVQWFVKPEEMKYVTTPLDMVSFWLTAGVIICIIAAVLLTRYSGKFPIMEKLVSQVPPINHKLYLSYFMTVMNVFFVMILLTGGFFAPNLILPEYLLPLGVFLQAAIVVGSSFSISLAGAIILLTTAIIVFIFPPIAINYVFELMAIGIFMLLNGPIISTVDQWIFSSNKEKLEWRWKRSVLILRVGIGMQLVVLAFIEKLISPGWGLVFVEMYPFYNFFPALGFEQVSNLHFVYFVGICEMTLGFMLMLGIASRIVVVVLAAAFTTTAIIHGLTEILGHLPIFAAAVILLLECVNKPEGLPCRKGV